MIVLVDGEPVEIPARLAEEIRRLQAFEQRTIQAEADRQELLHGGGEGLLAWAAAQHPIARIILTDEAERRVENDVVFYRENSAVSPVAEAAA